MWEAVHPGNDTVKSCPISVAVFTVVDLSVYLAYRLPKFTG